MTVQGPLQQAPSLKGEYAGFASRFLAFAIDLGVLVAASGLFNWVIIAAVGLMGIDLVGPIDESANDLIWTFIIVGRFVLIVLPFFLQAGYWFIFWTVTGQTVGKRIMGVRVVRIDGAPMKVTNTARRLAMYYLSMLPFFLGFTWILIDNERRGWHDRFSGTCVIYTWDARLADSVIGKPRPIKNQ